jgi:chromosome segregation ATPase
VILAAASPALADVSSGQAAANPIRKVVTMLQMMQKKVEAEGEKEKELFDKFMCYCKNSGGDLGQSVETANTRIPQLGSDIEEAEAKAVSLKEELKTAQTDRSAAKAAMAEATAVRDKEHAGFVTESTELKTNIGAVEKAVTAISNGMAGSFVQTGAAQVLKKLVLSSESMLDADRQDLVSFLSGGSGDAEEYTPQSGEITGILKTLGDEMKKSLAASQAAEDSAVATFDDLMAAKKKEVEALTAEIEAKMTRSGELAVEIVQMKNDLTDTEESLIEDQKFLKDLEKDCKTKEEEWGTVLKMRQEELVALADTIKILNDDDALEMFKKTLAASSASFVQMSLSMKTERDRAIADIRKAQHQAIAARPGLDFIALALQGKAPGFGKVIKMIDEMVATLKQEGLDDEHKKEYCAAQFDLMDDKKKGLETKISNLETTIENAKEGITKLAEEIEALDDGVKALDKQVESATEQRHAENKDYQELMASDSAAKELLEFAKNRLNKFYNPKLYKAPEGASLMQISSHVQKDAPPPPPEAPGAFKKKGEESSGVIAMIDVLIKDLDRELTEAEVVEKDAQGDYEAMMSDSSEKRAADTKALTEKIATKANLKSDLETAGEDKDSASSELMATESYISQLHAECDWLLKYFDMRKEARDGEIESLNNAKAVLSGADFSLMQTKSRNFLRRQEPSSIASLKQSVTGSEVFQKKVQQSCAKAPAEQQSQCGSAATDALFCKLLQRTSPAELSAANCTQPNAPTSFIQLRQARAPEDDLAQEMTHDLEMNFNKIAPFGKEDTAKELQDHAAKTQDTLVDAVENAEVAEIKRAVFRALTRLRAATIKEFDTIARLETQAIDAYNDAHHYRAENPLTHLHEDEAPVETDKLKSFH